MIVVIQGKRYHCLLHLCYLFSESSHSLCCPLSLQSNRELPSRRSITPLRDIGVSARDFTGFSTTVPSPRTSSPIPVRTNMSLPVSPCSSPLRQFKQSNWSCLPSPPHPMLSSGAAAYNSSSYALNQARRMPDPWQDGSLKLHSPYGSPKRF